MEDKFYPFLNFIGHLETGEWDVKRLLDRLHPGAWDKFGASGWGKFGNESLMASSSSLVHAGQTEHRLTQYYAGEEMDKRVEKLYARDYANPFLDLKVSGWRRCNQRAQCEC